MVLVPPSLHVEICHITTKTTPNKTTTTMLLRRASVAVLRAVRGSTCHAAAAAPSSTAWRWQPSVVSFSTTVPSLQQAAASSSETAAPSYTLTDVSADADLVRESVNRVPPRDAHF